MIRGTSIAVVLVMVAPAAVSHAAEPGDAKAAKDPKAAKAAKKALKKAKKKAKRLAKKAKKLYAKGKYDDAISAFEVAHEAHPDPRYLFNIGRCHERKGDLFKAMEYVQGYVDTVEDESEKEDAEDLYAILRNKLVKTSGELHLTTEPAGATALMTGKDAEYRGTTPQRRWLSAGEWTVALSKDGFVSQELKVSVGIGENIERAVKLQSEADAKKLAEEEAAKKKAEEEAARKKAEEQKAEAAKVEAARKADEEAARKKAEDEAGPGWPVWASFGAAAVFVAGGAAMGLLAGSSEDKVASMKDEPNRWSTVQDEQRKAESRATVANVLYGLGAAAAVTGVVVWGAF